MVAKFASDGHTWGTDRWAADGSNWGGILRSTDRRGGSRGSVSGRALDFGLIGVSTCGFESHQGPFRSLTFPPVLRDWVIKGFGMSSLVYATGHIKDTVPLVEKSRGLSPGGRFPPSFIHQVVIITGLNKLQLYVLALKMTLDADRA